MTNVQVDTPTPNLGLMLQPSQRNRGIWGENLNDVILKIDEVFSTTSLSLTGGTYALQREAFDQDEAAPLIIKITGALVGPQSLIMPQSTRPYWISNLTTGPFALTVTTGQGTGRIIQQGGTTAIRVDGPAISIISVPVSPDGVSLGSSLFADINVSGTAKLNNVEVSGSQTINGNLSVAGTASFSAITGINLTITGSFAANGLSITGTASVGDLAATNGVFNGSVSVGSDHTVAGNLSSNTLAVASNGNVAGNFSVAGTLTAGSFAVANFGVTTLTVSGTATLAAANITTLNVLSTATLASDPTLPLQAATKQYVDAIASGIQWKASVNVATTANIALSGTQTIDGVGVIAGNRVLVKNQTNPIENGIWVVGAGSWTRSTDADTDAEINGMVCFVSAGTTNGGQSWIIATSPATIAGPKTYVLFSANTAEVDWSLEQW